MITGIPALTQCPGILPIETLVERAVETVSVLIDATHNFEVDDAIAAFRPLIGLGPGLTPSGDDFIVGYLTGLWSTAGSDSSRLRFISFLGAWLSQAAAGTNAISRTYIKSAGNGNVSEPIATLAQRVGQAKSMDRVRERHGLLCRWATPQGPMAFWGCCLAVLPGQIISADLRCRASDILTKSLTSFLLRLSRMLTLANFTENNPVRTSYLT